MQSGIALPVTLHFYLNVGLNNFPYDEGPCNILTKKGMCIYL
jgi:hypothetical protein